MRTPPERAHAVEVTVIAGSPSAARRVLRREWGRRGLPTARTLARWLREFREGAALEQPAEHADP